MDRDAGAHQHVVHSGQHRAVDRVGGRQLELLEVVDADRPVVALLRQPDLGEVGDHGELTQRRRRLDPTEWHAAVARALSPSTRREPPVEHAGRQRRDGEVCVGATQVTTVVTVTQTAGMHDIESGARDHSELAECADRSRQAPVGHRHTHTALDDRRVDRYVGCRVGVRVERRVERQVSHRLPAYLPVGRHRPFQPNRPTALAAATHRPRLDLSSWST